MDKEKRYIFPNFMAEMMSKVDTRVQFEASLMSMLFILIGMLVMAVYMIFFTEFTLFMKIMVGVNSVAGFIFLWSYLVTTYQQYTSYLEAAGVMEEVGVSIEDIKNRIEETKDTELKVVGGEPLKSLEAGAIAPLIAIDLKRKEEKETEEKDEN